MPVGQLTSAVAGEAGVLPCGINSELPWPQPWDGGHGPWNEVWVPGPPPGLLVITGPHPSEKPVLCIAVLLREATA